MAIMASKKVKTHYLRFKKDKIDFNIGDSVTINEYNDDVCYAKILDIWSNSTLSDGYCKIQWYYKPTDLFKPVPSFISSAELMVSNLEQSVSLQTIYEKIKVLTFEEYHKNEEVDQDTFYTRSFYDYTRNTLRPPLSQWSRVCECQTIINPDHTYFHCDSCGLLFHGNCVGFIDITSAFICSKCSIIKN